MQMWEGSILNLIWCFPAIKLSWEKGSFDLGKGAETELRTEAIGSMVQLLAQVWSGCWCRISGGQKTSQWWWAPETKEGDMPRVKKIAEMNVQNVQNICWALALCMLGSQLSSPSLILIIESLGRCHYYPHVTVIWGLEGEITCLEKGSPVLKPAV